MIPHMLAPLALLALGSWLLALGRGCGRAASRTAPIRAKSQEPRAALKGLNHHLCAYAHIRRLRRQFLPERLVHGDPVAHELPAAARLRLTGDEDLLHSGEAPAGFHPGDEVLHLR